MSVLFELDLPCCKYCLWPRDEHGPGQKCLFDATVYKPGMVDFRRWTSITYKHTRNNDPAKERPKKGQHQELRHFIAHKNRFDNRRR